MLRVQTLSMLCLCAHVHDASSPRSTLMYAMPSLRWQNHVDPRQPSPALPLEQLHEVSENNVFGLLGSGCWALVLGFRVSGQSHVHSTGPMRVHLSSRTLDFVLRAHDLFLDIYLPHASKSTAHVQGLGFRVWGLQHLQQPASRYTKCTDALECATLDSSRLESAGFRARRYFFAG